MRHLNIRVARTAVLSLGLLVALFCLPAVAQTADQGTGTSGATTTQPKHHKGAKASDSTANPSPSGTAADQSGTNPSATTPSDTNPSASTTNPDQTNPNAAATQPAGTTNSGGGGGGWGLWGLVGLFGLFGLGGGRRRAAVDETRTDVRRIA